MIPIPTYEVLITPKGVMNKGFIYIKKNRRITSFTTKQNPCIYNDGIIKHVSYLRHVEHLWKQIQVILDVNSFRAASKEIIE